MAPPNPLEVPKQANEKLQLPPKTTRKQNQPEDGEDSPQEALIRSDSNRQTSRSNHNVNPFTNKDEPHAVPHRHTAPSTSSDASNPPVELTYPEPATLAASSYSYSYSSSSFRNEKAIPTTSTASQPSSATGETMVAQANEAGGLADRKPRRKRKKTASNALSNYEIRRSERAAKIEPEFRGLGHGRGSVVDQTAETPGAQVSQVDSFGGQAQPVRGDLEGELKGDDDDDGEVVQKLKSVGLAVDPTGKSAISPANAKMRTLRSALDPKSVNSQTLSSPSLAFPIAGTAHTLPSAPSLKGTAARASLLPSRTSLGAHTPRNLRSASASESTGNQAYSFSPPFLADSSSQTQDNWYSAPPNSSKRSSTSLVSPPDRIADALRNTLRPKTTAAPAISTASSRSSPANRTTYSGTHSYQSAAGVESNNSEASVDPVYRKHLRNNSTSPVASSSSPATCYVASPPQSNQVYFSNSSVLTDGAVHDFLGSDSDTPSRNHTTTSAVELEAAPSTLDRSAVNHAMRPRFAPSKRPSSANKRSSRNGAVVAVETANTGLKSNLADPPTQHTSNTAAELLTPGRVTRAQSSLHQSAAKFPGGDSQESPSIVTEAPKMGPAFSDDNLAETALIGLSVSNNIANRRLTRATAAKGRKRTRRMGARLDAGLNNSLNEEAYRESIKENQTPILTSPGTLPRNCGPLTQFEWNTPINEELGNHTFKSRYTKKIEEVRAKRNIAGEFDPHTLDRIQAQKEKYTLRVMMTMEQWPTSNVRGAQDAETLAKRKLHKMVREAELKNRLEEETARQAGRAKREHANKNHEELNHESDATVEQPEVAVAQEVHEGPAGGESAETDRIHPDIPRSFHEDFRLRQATAAASTASQLFLSVGHSSKKSFMGLPPPLTNNHTSLATNEAFSFGTNQAFSFESSQNDWGINNLPPSINDRAAQTTVYAADFPWKRASAKRARAPAETLSEVRAREEYARKTAEELMDENFRIEGAEALLIMCNGPTLFQAPFRMHDFNYRNLVASGRIGGPQAGAPTQPPPQPRGPYQRAAKEGMTRDEYNERITDMMTNHLGLQLEPTPPPGECFPPLTGPWPELPGWLTGMAHPFDLVRSFNHHLSGAASGVTDAPCAPAALGAIDEQPGSKHEAQRLSDTPTKLGQD